MVKKHILDTDNDLWKKVQLFRLTADQPNINTALIVLIERGLQFTDVLSTKPAVQQVTTTPMTTVSTSAEPPVVKRGPGRPRKNEGTWSQETKDRMAEEMRKKYGIEIPAEREREHRPITVENAA